jgi:hypothetical protein
MQESRSLIESPHTREAPAAHVIYLPLSDKLADQDQPLATFICPECASELDAIADYADFPDFRCI